MDLPHHFAELLGFAQMSKRVVVIIQQRRHPRHKPVLFGVMIQATKNF
jgi:hypothetical protein